MIFPHFLALKPVRLTYNLVFMVWDNFSQLVSELWGFQITMFAKGQKVHLHVSHNYKEGIILSKTTFAKKHNLN